VYNPDSDAQFFMMSWNTSALLFQISGPLDRKKSAFLSPSDHWVWEVL